MGKSKVLKTVEVPKEPSFMEKMGGVYQLYYTTKFSASTQKAIMDSIQPMYDKIAASGYSCATQPGMGDVTCDSPDNKIVVVFTPPWQPPEGQRHVTYVCVYIRKDVIDDPTSMKQFRDALYKSDVGAVIGLKRAEKGMVH
ncbi:MAG: hypothetical protein KGH98_04950 [Candidatus Micrarchaeota archaeon]|nr:hypothetical protein [Candidatus Micrarchaeota archaeon]